MWVDGTFLISTRSNQYKFNDNLFTMNRLFIIEFYIQLLLDHAVNETNNCLFPNRWTSANYTHW